jgi:hypothetical protein
MEASVAPRRKPPYASALVIDSFFEKLKSIAPPQAVDSKWATQYGLDPKLPSSIPGMLKWIGVIDDGGKVVSNDVWNKLRFPTTREEALAPLVRDGYREIFEAITVEDAEKGIIEATFGQAYGSGEVGRVVTCFVTLCRHAGIKTTAGVGRQAKETMPRVRTVSGESPKPKKQDTARKPEGRDTRPLSLGMNLTVELPADWTEEQIEKRIKTISRALQVNSPNPSRHMAGP